MNSDLLFHATIVGAAFVGVALGIRKSQKPDASITVAYALAVAIATVSSAVLHAFQTDFVFLKFEGKVLDGVIAVLLGVCLLLTLIATVSGVTYWLVRLSCIAITARHNMK